MGYLHRKRTSSRPQVLLLGPCRLAVSGVSTHINHLLSSHLTCRFELLHFQVGSEGRVETPVDKMKRAIGSPVGLAMLLARRASCHVHLNTSLEPRSYWRDLIYLAIARSMGHHVVYQVHGGALPAEFFPPGSLRSALLRRVLRAASCVVLLASIEEAAYRQFEPRAKVVVIPNAIDMEALATSPSERKSDGPLELVYLGRLAENKGIFTALEAVKLACQQGRHLRFTVAGTGPDEERFLKRAGELGLERHFCFLGPISGQEKAALWRQAHIFLFPTWHREGLPYALLEAMASRAVPITTRVGAIPDVMQHEVHGLFVSARDPRQLAEAIARLDDDRALLARLGRVGYQRISEYYTIDRLAASFVKVYDDLLGADRRTCAA